MWGWGIFLSFVQDLKMLWTFWRKGGREQGNSWILVWATITEYTEQVANKQQTFLCFWSWKPGSGCQHGWVLVRALARCPGCQPLVSSHSREMSGVSSIRALTKFRFVRADPHSWELYLHDLFTSPKPHLQIPSFLAVRFTIRIWERHRLSVCSTLAVAREKEIQPKTGGILQAWDAQIYQTSSQAVAIPWVSDQGRRTGLRHSGSQADQHSRTPQEVQKKIDLPFSKSPAYGAIASGDRVSDWCEPRVMSNDLRGLPCAWLCIVLWLCWNPEEGDPQKQLIWIILSTLWIWAYNWL